MFIFRTVRQFFSAPPDSLALTPAIPQQSGPPIMDWESTTGRFTHPQQECSLTYHKSEINGTCTGKTGGLTGSAMAGLFDDLPTWLPSMLIRVSIQAEEGELIASLREESGEIISIRAPGTLECNTELVGGRVWLCCESGPTPVRDIRYKCLII